MICTQTAFAEFNKYDNEEQIEYSVRLVDKKQFSGMNTRFTPIDLSPYANRGFRDEKAGDKTGGWSDQGENDMREYSTFGNVEYLGVPFTITDPSRNNGKGVVGVQGQSDPELKNSVEIPVNDYCGGVYFLHSAPYGKPGQLCGRYRFVYTDGSSAYLDIIRDTHVNNFWGQLNTDYCRAVWVGENPTSKQNNSKINLSMFALNNPHSDKRVKSIMLETEGDGAYLMVVGMTLCDSQPCMISLTDGYLVNPYTDGWRSLARRDSSAAAGTAADVSYLLDAPAGKHGKLTASGDSFVFEDGTKAKFWGVNLVGKANFPNEVQCGYLADELAQSGVSMVRMTELYRVIADDADESGKDAAMDNLCRFISALKDRGIYTYLTLDATDENRIESFFDESMIAQQQEYIKNLLSYKNPYTGIEIGKDPCVAMVEFNDSNGMLMYSSQPRGGSGIESDEIYNELKVKFNDYLKAKYKSTAALKKAWTAEHDAADILGDIEVLPLWNSTIYSKARLADTAEFLTKVQNDYYDTMKAYLSSVGFDLLSSCASNGLNFFEYADIKARATGDFVSSNAANNTVGRLAYNDKSSYEDKNLGMISYLLSSRVSGKPYVASEWNTSFAAPFGGDSTLITAAVAAQQGWSAMQYNYTDALGDDGIGINNYYSVRNDASRAALLPAAAILYSGLDELRGESTYNASGKSAEIGSFDNGKGSFAYKSGVSFDKKASAQSAPNSGIKNSNIVFDYADKIYQIRTANTEAFSGMPLEKESTAHMDAYVNNTLCTVALSVLDGKSFSDGGRYLLTTVARTRNSGMTTGEMNIITDFGGETLSEPVTGSFELKLGNCRVYALDLSGRRIAEIATERTADGIRFSVNNDNAAVYYEIEGGAAN